MSRITGRLVASAVALLLVGVSSLDAQRPQTREGFWANLGAGWASLGCNDCSSRETGTAGALALGAPSARSGSSAAACMCGPRARTAPR